MDLITEAQLAAVFATIPCTLNNIIQTTSTWNQRLDMVAFRLNPTAREVVEESSSTTQPHRSSAKNPSLRNDVKNKNVEIGNRNKGPKKRTSKIGLFAKCKKCQGYWCANWQVYQIVTSNKVMNRVLNSQRLLSY